MAPSNILSIKRRPTSLLQTFEPIEDQITADNKSPRQSVLRCHSSRCALPSTSADKALEEIVFLLSSEEKQLRVGTKGVGPTRCGSTAHELTRVVVVPESYRMAQLVGHEVTTDIGEPKRDGMKLGIAMRRLSVFWKDIAKETKAPSDNAMIKSSFICIKPDGGPTSALCPSSIA